MSNQTSLNDAAGRSSPEAKRFAALFVGLDRAHGTARLTGEQSVKGKAEAEYRTVHQPITVGDWRRHLEGSEGLVVHPLRDDGTVTFGAIDIDVYPLDHRELAKRINAAELPLIVCRSKSGGAHCYAFFGGPIKASVARNTLSRWAAAIGHAGCEIFPKQVALTADCPDGNGIGVPYFGAEASLRYAVNVNGGLTIEEFLAAGEAAKINGETALVSIEPTAHFDSLAAKTSATSSPPFRNKTQKRSAGRNDYLFRLGAHMRRLGAPLDEVKDAILKKNAACPIDECPEFAEGPLPETEIKQTIFRSIAKPKYERRADLEWDLSDVGNGERLAERHGHDMRYCAPMRTWFVWDGSRWRPDDNGEAIRRAKDTVGAIYLDAAAVAAADPELAKKIAKHALSSHSRPRVEATAWAAQSELPVRADELDTHDDKLNLENGTLDLISLTLRDHDRDDLLTKVAQVALSGHAICPAWEAFLDTTFGGDRVLIRFVQRAVGYTLTGHTGEQVLFLLYGTGANGKSTFLEILLALMGEYGRPTEFRALLTRSENSEAVRNDLAALAGLRLVTAVEVSRGRALDEAVIKQITGGDTITARKLYQEFFDFRPRFKLWLAANHKPTIKGQDEAIWRRVLLIPFEVYVPPEGRDRDLPRKLRDELPGILNWAVEGLRAYQSEGLSPPEKVLAATAEYRDEMDLLGDFINTCCVLATDLHRPPSEVRVPTGELFDAYAAWCAGNGEEPVKKRTFGAMLKERGFADGTETIHKRQQRVKYGIALRRTNEGPPDAKNEIPF